MERTEIVNQSNCKVGDSGKGLDSRVAANLLYNWRFWKRQNGYSYRKCMVSPCIENTEWFFSWMDFWFKMLLTFKTPMPLLANLTFRNGWFLFSVASPTLAALNSLFEEISKIRPYNRCPGDPKSAKCKIKEDSYKACSRFNAIQYTFVRTWWRPNCKLTKARDHRMRYHVSQAYYIWSNNVFDVSCWFCQTEIQNIYWHPGLVRFPMLSMCTLQPYGAAVPSCRIQCFSRFRQKGVLKLGLFVGWYIFSNIRTFMDKTEWTLDQTFKDNVVSMR